MRKKESEPDSWAEYQKRLYEYHLLLYEANRARYVRSSEGEK